MSNETRLNQQLTFLSEADKLKSVLRATRLCDGSRFENSGEHSWHIALYALVLAEHAAQPVRIERVIQMLLIHDLVEIDAGDAPIHGDHDPVALQQKEQQAAKRIFGLLPADQARAFRQLWEEFEAAETDDAIFAKAIDRVQPVISNLENDGHSWRAYQVRLEQVEARVGTKVARGAPLIWQLLQRRVQSWFQRGER
ncbi:MAG: hydrolase [Rhodobacterales bacterium]|nr:MAG: hydrolase [Rhodobacterales bacterium]